VNAEPDYGDHGGLLRRVTPDTVARLVAVSALLLAACIVVSLLLEAAEPSPRTPAPQIQPLPQSLIAPGLPSRP
jgi:hypothetical protein